MTAPTTRPASGPKSLGFGIIDRIRRAATLALRAMEFGYYHALLSTVDRVSRLPRNTTVPEATAKGVWLQALLIIDVHTREADGQTRVRGLIPRVGDAA